MVASVLKRKTPGHETLAYVSSPLGRACATTKIILETLGLPRERYATDARLMEMNLGHWEGLTHAEARARDPRAYDARAADKWTIRIPGGESYADVAERVQSWFGSLTVDTFAVSHGGFLRILRGLFAGLTWQQMSDLDEPQGVLFRVSGSAVERLGAQENE